MVKKKGKSKRTTLKDKYKIQRRVLETSRKRKKQGKRDAAAGKGKQHQHAAKDPGIPNSWPFKQDLLRDIQRTRERQQDTEHRTKEQRKLELKALREHQAGGGAARTVAELVAQAESANTAFSARQQGTSHTATAAQAAAAAAAETGERSDGTVAAGQQSRRAYLRELKRVVDGSDVLLQVLDARDPIGSRMNPAMESAILARADKRMVLVLNKIDLVPKAVVGEWLTALRRSRPTVAVKAGSSHMTGTGESATASQVPLGMDGLLQLLKNYARTTGGSGGSKGSKTTIVVGIVGYPNTGKSSIINALKRCRAVGVSSRPGFTTCLQEVVLDRNVRLLDSPGVVFDDRSALLGNCVDSESIRDPIPPVSALLQRCDHASLLLTYNIPMFNPGDTMMFLALVAKSHGRVLKGGIPDKVAAARAVLKDWNSGKIPYFTQPPKAVSTTVSSEAVVVSSFGKEFDLSKFDEAVLKTLKDTDEVDFVKMEHDADMELDDTSRQAVQFFANDDEEEVEEDDDGNDDEMDEDESSDDDDGDDDEAGGDEGERSRASLANADDYDFDEM